MPGVGDQACTIDVVDRGVQCVPNKAEVLSNKVEKTDKKEEPPNRSGATVSSESAFPLFLKFFNADLMFKEYNLRPTRGASLVQGSPPKKLKGSTGVKNAERNKSSKHERSQEAEQPPEVKRARLHETNGSDEVSQELSKLLSTSDDSQPEPMAVSDENQTDQQQDGKKGKTKSFQRRKVSVQRRKSQSHKRPQPVVQEGISSGNKAEDLLCAFCHQRDGAMNLGFLYGPYKFNHSNMDSGKDIIPNHPKELWVHEDCAVWAPGVCIVGGQLIGLQEAAADGDKMVCINIQLSISLSFMLCRCARLAKTLGPHCAAVLVDVKQLITTPVPKQLVSLILPKVKCLLNMLLFGTLLGCVLKEEQFLISCSKHRGTTLS